MMIPRLVLATIALALCAHTPATAQQPNVVRLPDAEGCVGWGYVGAERVEGVEVHNYRFSNACEFGVAFVIDGLRAFTRSNYGPGDVVVMQFTRSEMSASSLTISDVCIDLRDARLRFPQVNSVRYGTDHHCYGSAN